MKRSPIFDVAWYTANTFLILSIIFALYSMAWEYSMRRYLQGFSNAIIPADSSTLEKVETILSWMTHGPKRRDGPEMSTRDPEQTLNYEALLRLCGTATNAFVNLANASGISARRLLLLNDRNTAIHVVAEVWMDDRWIVVDPSFAVIPRGPDGTLLTRDDLAKPEFFKYVFDRVPGYNEAYVYARTVHLRVARIPYIGRFLRSLLDRAMPGWEESVFISLLAERLSFTAIVVSLLFVFIGLLARLALRHYGENHLGVHYGRLRYRLWRAFQSFVREPS